MSCLVLSCLSLGAFADKAEYVKCVCPSFKDLTCNSNQEKIVNKQRQCLGFIDAIKEVNGKKEAICSFQIQRAEKSYCSTLCSQEECAPVSDSDKDINNKDSNQKQKQTQEQSNTSIKESADSRTITTVKTVTTTESKTEIIPFTNSTGK